MFLRGKKVRKRVAWRVHIRTQIQSLFIVKERLVATRKFYIYVNNHYQSWL